MRCFSIIGVPKNATAEEINEKYEKKMEIINQHKDEMSEIAYDNRIYELSKARDMCIDYVNSKGVFKAKIRLSDAYDMANDPARLYSCIGPCTCIDANCCCCTCAPYADHSSGCNTCMSNSGGTSPAVYCDIAIYVILGIRAAAYFYEPISDAISNKTRAKALRKQRENELRDAQIRGVREKYRNIINSRQVSVLTIRELSKHLSQAGESLPIAVAEIKENQTILKRQMINYADNCQYNEAVEFAEFLYEITRDNTYKEYVNKFRNEQRNEEDKLLTKYKKK